MSGAPPQNRKPLPSPDGAPDPRAAGAPDPRAAGATPAIAQWFAAKAAHPDALIFFRMGDFFEMLFEDAEVAAAALDIALSSRGEHQGAKVALCGVPAHAMDSYLGKLIRQGFRVAICDQTETPEEQKRRRAPTIRREVTRLVTPGTVTEETLLDAGRPAWLLALAPAGDALGAAWLDVTTGAFGTERIAAADLPALVARLEPAEILAPEAIARGPALLPLADRTAHVDPPRDGLRRVTEAFAVATLDG